MPPLETSSRDQNGGPFTSSMCPVHPAREQTCTTPPDCTSMLAMGASHSGHGGASFRCEWQWGQNKAATSFRTSSVSDSVLWLPYSDDSQSQPCPRPWATVTRMEGCP